MRNNLDMLISEDLEKPILQLLEGCTGLLTLAATRLSWKLPLPRTPLHFYLVQKCSSGPYGGVSTIPSWQTTCRVGQSVALT